MILRQAPLYLMKNLLTQHSKTSKVDNQSPQGTNYLTWADKCNLWKKHFEPHLLSQWKYLYRFIEPFKSPQTLHLPIKKTIINIRYIT